VTAAPGTTAWLAVGRRAANAFGDGARAGGAACAEDVHEALLHLAEGGAPCLVDAESVADRPRAALRALTRAAVPHPVVLLWDRTAPGAPLGVSRAAAHLGVLGVREGAEARALLGSLAGAREGLRDASRGQEGPGDVEKERLPEDEGVSAPEGAERPEGGEGPGGDAARDAEFVDGCFRRLDRPDALCRHVLKRLCEASGARRASLMLLDGTRTSLFLKAAKGVQPSLVGQARALLGTGVAGRCASLGRAVTGRGSAGGPRAYGGSAYVVLPLGRAGVGEGVASLTDLPQDRLPSRAAMKRLRRMAFQAGRALAAARRLESAEALSTTDELTGLPNRRSFGSALQREIERARRTGARLAVALLDVDHFKRFNDRFGHPVGDQVLRQIARRLASAFRRETDLVARYGGEEFGALLTGLGADAASEAMTVIERARQAVRAKPLTLGPGHPPSPASVSGGIAVFPVDGETPEELLRRADAALYEAKREGRDRVKPA
jgi:diguanylate cyclase (GGDEF)-like protein